MSAVSVTKLSMSAVNLTYLRYLLVHDGVALLLMHHIALRGIARVDRSNIVVTRHPMVRSHLWEGGLDFRTNSTKNRT